MQYTSLFDSFFAPTRVIVVSEERLRQAEQEARQNQLDVLDHRIDELTKYRNSLYEEIKSLTPPMKHADLDSLESNITDSGVQGGDADV